MGEFIKSEEIFSPKDATILMPVGGLGTRALEITQDLIPKSLIKLDGNITILDVICQSLVNRGFRNFVFCVGYHSSQILEKLQTHRLQFRLDDVNYAFSYEDEPIGGDAAILQAISRFNIQNPAISIPGDLFLPWDRISEMVKFHLTEESDITFALTSCVTERTSDIGKVWIDKTSKKVIRCFGRNELLPLPSQNLAPLTSGGAFVIDTEAYKKACRTFVESNSLGIGEKIDFRDNLLPWLLSNGDFIIKGYDLEGEVLDIGVPERIRYAQQNWKNYL